MDLLYALSHRQDSTYHTAFDGPVVDHWLERKTAQTANESSMQDRSAMQEEGSIRHAGGSKLLQQSALPPELCTTPALIQ